MPHKINRKTITKINPDGPERVDPEWVKRRKVWAQQDVFYEELCAQAARLEARREIKWALEGRNMRTRLMRLYIIGDLPVADVARVFKITPHAVRKHKRELRSLK